ncbi:MAG: cell division protein FtsB [Gammaproteobacteria bacterium]|nr:cell division protein FtsB [Gammaproteobacteria bacterium]
MRTLIATLLVVFVLLQYRLWFGDGSLIKVWQLKQALIEQQNENQRLSERNRVLEAEVRDLKEGVAAIEERARTELGMIRDGETFYQVVEE